MGIDMSAIDWDGPTRQTCPACGRGPKDRTCGVTVDERGGVAHCFRCGYQKTERGAQIAGRPVTANRARHETLSDYGRELWRSCRPLGGDALSYLKARNCVIPPADGDLRWHPALKHGPTAMVGPALVALGTDAVTGVPLTLLRAWIGADGNKAPVNPPRMLLGGHRKAGAVVRLSPDEAVTTGLAIAEGIETALSLAHGFRPVWACIDAGNLAAFPILDGIESLTIAADNDEPGIAAAEACANRWTDAGREVRLVMAPTPKADLNDMARAA